MSILQKIKASIASRFLFKRSVYHAADHSDQSLRNWDTVPVLGQNELDTDEALTLISRSYDCLRNQPFSAAYLNQVALGAVSTGLSLNVGIDNDMLELQGGGHSKQEKREIEEDQEKWFSIWAKESSFNSNRTFWQDQHLIMITALTTGTTLINTPWREREGNFFGTKIDVVDTNRLSSPTFLDTDRIVRGIESDRDGFPLAAHLTKIQSLLISKTTRDATQWVRIPFTGRGTRRRRLLHVYTPKIPGEVTGVSILAPMMKALKSMDRYSEAEIAAAVTNGSIAFFIQDLPSAPLSTQGSGLTGTIKDDPQAGKRRDGGGIDTWDLEKSSVLKVPAHKEVKFFNPQRPNATFDPFIMSVGKQVAASGNMPLDQVMLFFDKSFSSARMSLNKAQAFFNFESNEISTQFCGPIFELIMDEAVARGYIRHIKGWSDPLRRYAYLQHEWLPSAEAPIDETKAVKGGELKVKMGFSSTPRQATKFSGVSFKKLLREQKQFIDEVKDLGLEEFYGIGKKPDTTVEPKEDSTEVDDNTTKEE